MILIAHSLTLYQVTLETDAAEEGYEDVTVQVVASSMQKALDFVQSIEKWYCITDIKECKKITDIVTYLPNNDDIDKMIPVYTKG